MLAIFHKIADIYCRNKLSGFSIIDVMITVAIVVMIASSALVSGGNILNNGRYNAAKSDIASISLAVSQYKFEIGNYPVTLDELESAKDQYGPWLSDSSRVDPWGNDYHYAYIAAQKKIAVWSSGPDGNNNSGNAPTAFSGDDIGIFGH